MNEEAIGAFLVGVVSTAMTLLFVFLMLWITPNVVNETSDGRFYISTHFSKYELKTNKPINIGTIVLDKMEEKDGKAINI